MIYVGIDPGVTGAVAVFYPSSPPRVFDLPTVEVKQRRRIDLQCGSLGLPGWLCREIGAYEGLLVGLEEIRAIPTFGSHSSFALGQVFGQLEATLSAAGLPYELVPPKVWQAGLFRGKAKDPGSILLAARQKWPGLAEQLKRKKDHNRADALWIAEYLRRREQGAARP